MTLPLNIARTLGEACAVLLSALATPDNFTILLNRLGWQVQLTEDQMDVVNSMLAISSALGDLVDALTLLERDQRNETIMVVVETAAVILTALKELSSRQLGDISTLPTPLNTETFWREQLVPPLIDLLLTDVIYENASGLHGFMHLFGLVEPDVARGDLWYAAPQRLRWDRIAPLVADPIDHLKTIYGWNDDLQTSAIAEAVHSFVKGIGLAAYQAVLPESLKTRFYSDLPLHACPRITEVIVVDNGFVRSGARILPVQTETENGLYVGAFVIGNANSTLSLSSEMDIVLAGTPEIDIVGVFWQPGTMPEIIGSSVILDQEIRLIWKPETALILVGSPEGARLEVEGAELSLTLRGTANDPELILLIALLDDGFQVVIAPAEGDSFISALLGENELKVGVNIEIEWSSKDGFQIAGGAELDITFPVNLRVFFVTILELHLALGISAEGVIEAQADIDVSAVLGPFALTVGDIGVIATAVPSEATTAHGTFGGLEIGWAFKPPTSLGFTLDIEGIVTGGGFVSHDPALGRYAGALALDFLAVGLAAVVVVDTQLPGNPDGWALFASVSATFPSLPLGFGFFLSGVGGIVCLNRTMDTEALAAGLREGAIDALLFPDNVFDDARLIIAQLDAWFPQAEGSTVFGVAVTITWGTPKALITGELGVMLSFPDLNLALVGSISMALPDEEHALLELHMDTLGTVDVAAATVLVVASLYDSSLLSTIQLSGDMAMYSQFGAEPYFLLSVGGYHPNFHPPSYLPASVLNLRRMGCELTLSEDVWFKLENYVAVTSNTLQFGAKATLEASARFLGVTYVATGKVGFDVLLVFSPFSFAADLYASVTVSAKDTELLAVSLTAHLVGPQPWYLSGHARFEFLGIGVRFEILVGAAANVQAPPRMPVRDAVVAALVAPEAWRPVAPAGQTVLLANDTTDDSIVRVRPDANLEAVQTAAPLERTLDIYGIYAIDGPNLLHIQGAGIEGATQVTWAAVTDWFAPALYDQMNQVDKIAAPSYEQMSAGVRLSAGGMSWGDETQSVTPDYEVRVLNEDTTHPLSRQPLLGTLTSVTASLVLDRTRRQGLPRTVSGLQPFTLTAPGWTLIDATTGIASGTPASYPTVLNQLHNRTSNDPTAHSRLRLAPVHATREAA